MFIGEKHDLRGEERGYTALGTTDWEGKTNSLDNVWGGGAPSR